VSYAGVLYPRRAARGSIVPDRHSIGADFQLATSNFRGSDNLIFTGYFLKTPDGVRHGDDAGWGMRLVYPNDLLSGRVIFKEFQKNFDPAVGFAQRTDNREYNARMKLAPRPRNSRLVRQFGVEAWLDWYGTTRGPLVEKNDQYIFDVQLHSGDSASFILNPLWERLPAPFRIAPGITLLPGTEYDYTRYAFRFQTANRRKVAFDADFTVGTFYSGDRDDLRGTVSIRPRRGVLAQFTAQVNRVNLAEGSFTTRLLRTVINTQFTPFISVSNNVQYDSVSRALGWQSRFRWITTPGNDIYFVWMQNWLDVQDRLVALDRNAAVKLLYTYRF
jgi:hypothetical protein